ncbi:hypothetical protein GCM10027160_33270 [Streptomyces calidiresistens]|uniref:Uncharacterized protein n=1 Tax=Streptomyces calidiresistens TaxID=1485586 RepID=A0A7W3XXI2_9ACTN|nr:hypothetical protein [Streptomyces calidiresistens]MBB0230841.1 hypothetical protein [Streptomyces calidiresistens]
MEEFQSYRLLLPVEEDKILAERAPDLHQVLQHCRAKRQPRLVLESALMPYDKVAEAWENGNER